MEEAEHAMLRSVGLGVLHFEIDDQVVSWPRVSVTCDYHHPARFEEVLQVAVSVTKLGNKSVTFRCEFRRGDQPIATGQVVAACCIAGDDGRPRAVQIPPSYRAKLEQFQA